MMKPISRRQALTAGATLGVGAAGAGALLAPEVASAAPSAALGASYGTGPFVAGEARSPYEVDQAGEGGGGELGGYARGGGGPPAGAGRGGVRAGGARHQE